MASLIRVGQIHKQIAMIVNAKTEAEIEALYGDALAETERLGLAKIIEIYNEQYRMMDGRFKALAEKYK